MRRYVGVTGLMTHAEALACREALPEDQTLMVGVLASQKSLAGIKNRWHRRYPAPEDIGEIFVSDRRALNLIHYSGDVVDGEVVRRLLEVGGARCDGVQFNGTWPTERLVTSFETVVLQFRPGVSDAGLVRRLVRAGGSERVRVLIDSSYGRGEALDIAHVESAIRELRGWVADLQLGVAGGLCAEVLPLLRDFPRHHGLSIDAEGRLRDGDEGGTLNLERATAYLRAAGEIFGGGR